MPELPEVEFIRRELHPLLSGQTLRRVDGQYRPVSIVGQTITKVDRNGKYLLLKTDTHTLVIHLGMTGQIHVNSPGKRHERSRLTFDATTLSFVDTRGFGYVRELAPGEDAPGLLGKLGPDPLASWDRQRAVEGLTGRNKAIKGVLLDQHAIAGVGNYIADESLWRARLHPTTQGLTPAQAGQLTDAVVAVMNDSLKRGGVSMRDYQHADGSTGSAQDELDVYGRADQPCNRCGNALSKSTVAGRGSTWCRTCQVPPDARA